MKINSTSSAPMLKQVMKNTGKDCTKNMEAEQKEIDKEIQSLQQKKAALNKEVDNIKNDFAPPKPKEELIRPLKDQIQILDAQIQQKQIEKTKKQSENIQEASNDSDNVKSNFTLEDTEDKINPTSNNGKNKSSLKLLKNFTTQTGVINEERIKNISKNPDDPNTSDSTKSITEKKRQKYLKNAIDAYNTIENSNSVNLGTNVLS